MPAPFSDKRARRVARGPADPDGDHPGSFAHRTPQAHLAWVQPSVPTSFGSGAPSPSSVLSWVPDSPESIPREEGAALTTARDRDRTQEEETRFSRASQGPRGSKPCADAQQGRACSGALLPPLPSDPAQRPAPPYPRLPLFPLQPWAQTATPILQRRRNGFRGRCLHEAEQQTPSTPWGCVWMGRGWGGLGPAAL